MNNLEGHRISKLPDALADIRFKSDLFPHIKFFLLIRLHYRSDLCHFRGKSQNWDTCATQSKSIPPYTCKNLFAITTFMSHVPVNNFILCTFAAFGMLRCQTHQLETLKYGQIFLLYMWEQPKYLADTAAEISDMCCWCFAWCTWGKKYCVCAFSAFSWTSSTTRGNVRHRHRNIRVFLCVCAHVFETR